MDFKNFSDGNNNNMMRLEERYKRIVTSNLDAFLGKTVLDIAANNGRWTYAALDAGASHVTSIEGREARAADAVHFLDDLGYSGKYTANVGDMYDFLYETRNQHFDTVLCLGIYYHVMDHYHFLKQIARHSPTTIIIDSGFVRSFRSSVHVQYEDPSLHLNALSVFAGQKNEPVGFVSLGLMIQMAWNLGYNCRPILWDPNDVTHKSSVQDYMSGRRFTVRLDKIDGNYDADWRDYWASALIAVDKKFALLMNKETHDQATDTRAQGRVETAVFTIF
ncbi:class I SAM-dependent methyltransferase [Cypionkella sp. TWP1-2-1b2]|uniref:class I SAM-dependent methyltransferase n=1 Tax=Cypionkella sp. TWP1-2-1b2 TaxID=2804675 RepID=UPI003CF26F4F